eukprot:12801087-Alexandrium_andersonii.AAC.1
MLRTDAVRPDRTAAAPPKPDAEPPPRRRARPRATAPALLGLRGPRLERHKPRPARGQAPSPDGSGGGPTSRGE